MPGRSHYGGRDFSRIFQLIRILCFAITILLFSYREITVLNKNVKQMLHLDMLTIWQ